MKNRTVYSALLFAFLLPGLMSSPIYADDKAPIFIDCPGEIVYGCIGDSAFVQVKAVHPISEQAKSIRYFMVDGPGQVDPVTGIWSYLIEDTSDTRAYRKIEVGASIGNSPHKTYAEENCSFRINIEDARLPIIMFEDESNYGVFRAPVGERTEAPIKHFDPGGCGVEYEIVSIEPVPVGKLAISANYVLYFEPQIEDIDRRFVVTIRAYNASREMTRLAAFDTHELISPPEFVVCPQDTVTVRPCLVTTTPIRAVVPEYDDLLGIRYEIIEGPGWIDRSNRWVFRHDPDFPQSTFDVEVRASYLGESTVGEQNCRFSVKVDELLLPDFSRYDINPCGDTIRVVSKVRGSIMLRAAESDLCRTLQYSLESVSPQPTGSVQMSDFLGRDKVYIYYEFDPDDVGQVFTLQLKAYTVFDQSYCTFHIAVVDEGPIAVRIGQVNEATQGQIESLPIFLDRATTEISAFNFLIGYDPSALSFMSADEGSDMYEDGCGWEYFTYQSGDEIECSKDCPSGLIRLVGIAEIDNGDEHAECLVPDNLPVKMATLNFMVSTNRRFECTDYPIRFFWTECEDNSLRGLNYNRPYISRAVYDTCWNDISDPYIGTYPTYAGAQYDNCQINYYDNPDRIVDFYNGHISVYCVGYVDAAGDVNLNEIPNEIADALLFIDYLLYGDSVLTINRDGQLAATDLNKDGVVGSISDFTFMLSVIDSLRAPCESFLPSADTASFSVSEGTLRLNFDGEVDIGAIYLTIAGEIEPILQQENLTLLYHYDASRHQTKVLVYSMDLTPIQSGPILSGVIGHAIRTASAGSTTGRMIPVTFDEANTLRVRIDKVDDIYHGSLVDASIFLDQSPLELNGLNLLIRYDHHALGLHDVVAGSAISEEGCGWKYFTYRRVGDGLVRIVSIGAVNGNPLCFNPPEFPAEIARMTFYVTNDRTYYCDTLPIQFYWEECGDNSLANRSGDSLFISRDVFDCSSDIAINIVDSNYGYPTITGAQSSDCFADPNRLPTRRVDFYNGYLRFYCDYIDAAGDINLNEIPYEVADAILFAHYFVYGTDVFHKNTEGQIEATDVNRDGVPLTLEDFTYYVSIVTGEALAYPTGTSDDTAIFNYLDDDRLALEFASKDTIGAIQIIVADSIEPRLEYSDIDILYHFDGSETKILLYSLDRLPILSGLLLSNLNGHEVIEINAATIDGRHVATDITDNATSRAASALLPKDYAFYQNYPNPFNPTTTVRFDLPEPATVRFRVYNILGKTVYEYNHDYPAGQHELKWNGKSEDGALVASGVYYYRIQAGSFSQTRKMILLK